MATKQRSRQRRSTSRDRGPRYIAPVLDPTWQNPYAPSAAEREGNLGAVRAFALKKSLPQTVAAGVVALALATVGIATSAYYLIAVAVLLLGAYAFLLRSTLAKYDRLGAALGAQLLDVFKAGGTTKDRQRLITVLDRLAATFGVDGVSAFIVEDAGYNAALVPNGPNYSLFVTNSLMRDFELIELEGVVAHCLARQRLGLLPRQSVAAVANVSDAMRKSLAGAGTAYRSDEVAAAAIRYPLGLAGALRKCARQVVPATSYFASSGYQQNRWAWFNMWSDRTTSDLGDLNDVELRALALEEW